MTRFMGKGIVAGRATGLALITDQPVNFTAAFTKAHNLLPSKRGEFRDRHHPWFKVNTKGRILFLPACIGSTHTGLVLLDLVRLEYGPAAIVVERADSLLVAGVVLSDVWYGKAIPIVEHPLAELARYIKDGQRVEVVGDTGTILVQGAAAT